MKIEPFYLNTKNNGKEFTIKVEQTGLNDSLEQFTLSIGNRSVVIQSNRPGLRSLGLYGVIKFEMFSGEYKSIEALTWTIRLLEKHILMMEKQEFEKPVDFRPKVRNGELF